jgi:hypothetical protein
MRGSKRASSSTNSEIVALKCGSQVLLSHADKRTNGRYHREQDCQSGEHLKTFPFERTPVTEAQKTFLALPSMAAHYADIQYCCSIFKVTASATGDRHLCLCIRLPSKIPGWFSRLSSAVRLSCSICVDGVSGAWWSIGYRHLTKQWRPRSPLFPEENLHYC